MRFFTALSILILFSASIALAATAPVGVWEWTQTETAPGVYVQDLAQGNSLQRAFNANMTFTEYVDEEPVLSGEYWVQDIVIEDTDLTVLTMDFGGVSPARSPYVVNDSGMLQMYWGVDSQTGLPSYPIEYFASRAPISALAGTWDSFKALFR